MSKPFRNTKKSPIKARPCQRRTSLLPVALAGFTQFQANGQRHLVWQQPSRFSALMAWIRPSIQKLSHYSWTESLGRSLQPGLSTTHSVSFGMGMFLFIILLTVIFFLLAQSMVRHRFHEGGRIDSNGSMRQ